MRPIVPCRPFSPRLYVRLAHHIRVKDSTVVQMGRARAGTASVDQAGQAAGRASSAVQLLEMHGGRRSARRTLEKNLLPDWSSKLLSCVTSAPPAPLNLRVEEGACTRPSRRNPENLSSLALPEIGGLCLEAASTRYGTMSAAAALPDGTCNMKSDTRAHKRMAASPCHLCIPAQSPGLLASCGSAAGRNQQPLMRYSNLRRAGVQDPGSSFANRGWTCLTKLQKHRCTVRECIPSRRRSSRPQRKGHKGMFEKRAPRQSLLDLGVLCFAGREIGRLYARGGGMCLAT